MRIQPCRVECSAVECSAVGEDVQLCEIMCDVQGGVEESSRECLRNAFPAIKDI
jgi:hypothetical protein